jgi:hypothetical protein
MKPFSVNSMLVIAFIATFSAVAILEGVLRALGITAISIAVTLWALFAAKLLSE